MDRRGFLRGILAAAAAPAIVRASSLMPLWVPRDVIKPLYAPTLDEIIAATIQARSAELTANIVSNNALLRRLKENAVWKPWDGGETLPIYRYGPLNG